MTYEHIDLFAKGLSEYGFTYQHVKNTFYYCGGSEDRHLNYWKQLYNDAPLPERESKCLCAHPISKNCYITDGVNLLVLGNCCIKKFIIKSSRTCSKCGETHINRKDNLCGECRKKYCNNNCTSDNSKLVYKSSVCKDCYNKRPKVVKQLEAKRKLEEIARRNAKSREEKERKQAQEREKEQKEAEAQERVRAEAREKARKEEEAQERLRTEAREKAQKEEEAQSEKRRKIQLEHDEEKRIADEKKRKEREERIAGLPILTCVNCSKKFQGGPCCSTSCCCLKCEWQKYP